MSIIETSGLTKVYTTSFGKKEVRALLDLNLSISAGTIFGLLGPNGAGKTTLVKIFLGITYPTAGSARILNESISNYKIKSKVGYLPENHRYPAYLTGGEVLNFYGKLSGLDGAQLSKKIDELLELMKLTRWKKSKVKTYSKGMMQRLGLAQSMINNPDLIFLDEPTDGVDPIGRKEIRDILLQLKEQNKTIFLNSHLLSEVEMITDRVGILNKGKLLTEGTVKELTEKAEEYKISVEGDGDLSAYSGSDTLVTKLNNSSYSVKVKGLAELNLLVDRLRKNNVLLKEIIPVKTSLEEMFINLIQQSDLTDGDKERKL